MPMDATPLCSSMIACHSEAQTTTPHSGTDLGSLAGGDAQQFVVARREHVVRVAASRPDRVVAGQGDVDDSAERPWVPDGCDAAYGLCNPLRVWSFEADRSSR